MQSTVLATTVRCWSCFSPSPPPLQDNAAYIPVQPIEVQETYQIIISVWARIISKIIRFIVKLLENILRIKILWFLFILKSSLKKERKQSDSWENCEFPFFLVKAFLLYWLRRKNSVSSAHGSQENICTRDRGYWCHIASQLVQNGAQHLKSLGITINPLGNGP